VASHASSKNSKLFKFENSSSSKTSTLKKKKKKKAIFPKISSKTTQILHQIPQPWWRI
jgi:hypothetical protein